MNIVCQGIKGSYSYQTAEKIKEIIEKELNIKINKIINVDSFLDLIEKVKEGLFGVIPVENSIIGTIFSNYELIWENNLKIVYDYFLKIEHALLVSKEVNNLKEIEKVLSHPAALEQCMSFLKENNLKYEKFIDTAGAAKFVSEKKGKLAAIASKNAAKVYGLKVLKENIQDFKDNYTRFLIIHKDKDFLDFLKNKKNVNVKDTKKCKILTSFVFELKDKPAALFKALMPFATYGVNLKKIESIILKNKPFSYKFLLEAEISKEDVYFKDIVEELSLFIENLKVVSSFKRINEPF